MSTPGFPSQSVSRALADEIGQRYHASLDNPDPTPDAHPSLTEGQIWFKIATSRLRRTLNLSQTRFAQLLGVPLSTRRRLHPRLGDVPDHRSTQRLVRHWEDPRHPNLPNWERVRLIEAGVDWMIRRESQQHHWKVVDEPPPPPWDQGPRG